jgi:hypothetical protein
VSTGTRFVLDQPHPVGRIPLELSTSDSHGYAWFP